MSYTSSLKKHIQRDDLGGAIAPCPWALTHGLVGGIIAKICKLQKCVYIYIYFITTKVCIFKKISFDCSHAQLYQT
jgi:hypothetical protein